MNLVDVATVSSPARRPAGRIYFPNLDGLRFLAFFAVFLFHSFYTPDAAIKASLVYRVVNGATRSGDLGVNFFFVLSGFLITYLLLNERATTGRVAIGSFYMRRVLRIWPLYFVVVAIGFLVLPVVRTHFGQNTILIEMARPVLFLTFLANFNNLYYGCQTPTLTVLWSVCVEEQFYLVWPLLVAAVPTRRLGWLFGTILVGSLAFRTWHQADARVLNMHTFSVIGDMATGGAVAWLCFRDNRLVKFIERLPAWGILLGYALGVALIVGRDTLAELPYYVVIDRLLLAVFFAFVLLEQNYAVNSLTKMSRWPRLTYWGTYTYGLYCLHFLGLLAAYQLLQRLHLHQNVAGVLLGDTTLALVLAMVLSWLSFNYYEKPFLKLKQRFELIKTKL